MRIRSLVVALTLLLSTPRPVAQFPWESASTTRTLCPLRPICAATLITDVVLPTPPFWLITVTTLARPAGVGREEGRCIGPLACVVLTCSAALRRGASCASSVSTNSTSTTRGAFSTSGRGLSPSSAFIRAPSALGGVFNVPIDITSIMPKAPLARRAVGMNPACHPSGLGVHSESEGVFPPPIFRTPPIPVN